MPMTAAYCGSGRKVKQDKRRRTGTHIEDDLVEKLHGVAAKHQGHDTPVDLAAQDSEVDGGNALGIAVVAEVAPSGVDICLGARGIDEARRGTGGVGMTGGGVGRGADTAKSDIVAHLVVADGRHVERRKKAMADHEAAEGEMSGAGGRGERESVRTRER